MKNLHFLIFLLVLHCAIFASAQAQEAKPVEEIAPEPEKKLFDGSDFATLSRGGSIMFDRDHIQKLYAALDNSLSDNAFATSFPLELDDGLDDILISETPEEERIIPTFFVGSIMYYAPENWAIWLNGTRYRPTDTSDTLSILRVRERFVEIAWQDLELDTLIPRWRDLLSPVDGFSIDTSNTTEEETQAEQDVRKIQSFHDKNFQWSHVSPDGNIRFDSKNSIIAFRLNLHQTFVPERMEIVEGRENPRPSALADDSNGDINNLADEIFN